MCISNSDVSFTTIILLDTGESVSVENGLSSVYGELGHEFAVGLGILPQVEVYTDGVHSQQRGTRGIAR